MNGKLTVWVQQGTTSIGNSVCDMVDVRQSDGLVAVATHTRGVYTANVTSLSQITTVHNINQPNTNLQAEIYPNPSSGKATLSYNLAEVGNVQLRVFDQRGNLIEESQLNANNGDNITCVDISKQPAGIYFFNLVMGDKVKTIKMLVVK